MHWLFEFRLLVTTGDLLTEVLRRTEDPAAASQLAMAAAWRSYARARTIYEGGR